jgi:16S rRNA (guanine527-N7)-methyltransferase
MKYNDIIEQLNQPSFDLYYHYLIKENEKLNLTAITDKDDVYLKHFYDSLVIQKFVDFQSKKVLDIGAGAGFPSIPIKLVEPSMDLTIVDGLKKRIDFLNRLSEILNIQVRCIHGRAESMNLFNHFDVIMARAVAKLNVLVELALPALKIGGVFVAFKSIHFQSELNETKSAIEMLGGEVSDIIEYDLDSSLKHVYIVIKKNKKSPKGYPRHFSKIKKKPL